MDLLLLLPVLLAPAVPARLLLLVLLAMLQLPVLLPPQQQRQLPGRGYLREGVQPRYQQQQPRLWKGWAEVSPGRRMAWQ